MRTFFIFCILIGHGLCVQFPQSKGNPTKCRSHTTCEACVMDCDSYCFYVVGENGGSCHWYYRVSVVLSSQMALYKSFKYVPRGKPAYCTEKLIEEPAQLPSSYWYCDFLIKSGIYLIWIIVGIWAYSQLWTAIQLLSGRTTISEKPNTSPVKVRNLV